LRSCDLVEEEEEKEEEEEEKETNEYTENTKSTIFTTTYSCASEFILMNNVADYSKNKFV
jgi:hypothetical protein